MRILAQVAPLPNVLTDLYAVPEELIGGVAIAFVKVVNRSNTRLRARVAVSSDEGIEDDPMYTWAENVEVLFGRSENVPIDVILPPPSIIRVKANFAATFIAMGT